MNPRTHKSNFYPFSVWVSTILISPILLIFYSIIFYRAVPYEISGDILLFLFAVFFGFLWSIPTVIITVSIYYLLIWYKKEKYIIQLVNLLLGLIGIAITFILHEGFSKSLEFIFIYSLVWLVFSILLSPIEKSE